MAHKAWKVFVDVADDVLAYCLTVAGILAANYIPLLQSGQPINIDLGLGRVIIAGLVGLVLVGYQEQKGIVGADADTAAKVRAGKRANFKIRMINALMHGVAWPSILKIVAGLAG